jgi:hypothetical protein
VVAQADEQGLHVLFMLRTPDEFEALDGRCAVFRFDPV